MNREMLTPSVMAGLVPAIHVAPRRSGFGRAGGTSPGMTEKERFVQCCFRSRIAAQGTSQLPSELNSRLTV